MRAPQPAALPRLPPPSPSPTRARLAAHAPHRATSLRSCNVGYAFINFLSPAHILAFYEEFNFRKWDRFNSDKVCEIAYGRIQGKAALLTHFANSSLVHEDECYRPVVFASDGSGLRGDAWEHSPRASERYVTMYVTVHTSVRTRYVALNKASAVSGCK